jgi:multidrug resistance efflux pump
MPIRFRRIDSSVESVVQQRQRGEHRRRRWRTLVKVLTVMAIAILGLVLSIAFRPPRVVATAAVQVDRISVVSPVAGRIAWVIDKHAREVSQGEVLARVVPDTERNLAAQARVYDLRIQLAAAASAIRQATDARDALAARLNEEEATHVAELERLEGAAAKAEADRAQATQELEQQETDLAEAERLLRLGAVPTAEYTRFLRRRDGAQIVLQATESYVQSAEAEHGGGVAALQTFRESKRALLAGADAAVQSAQTEHEQTAAALAAQEAMVAGPPPEAVVTAPSDGLLLERYVAPDTHVRVGDAILDYYAAGSKLARAYVPVRFRHQLAEGRAARLFLAGVKDPIPGQVVHIHGRVGPVGRELVQARELDEPYTIPVDIQLTGPLADLAKPGDIGDALIDR